MNLSISCNPVLVIDSGPVLSSIPDSAPVIWILASPPWSWKFLWQNTAYLVAVLVELQGTFAIFTNIQTGCNLVKNSLNYLQTVRILPLNNPLPLGAFTNPSLFCFLCHDQWVLANHSSSLQPLQLLHRSLVRLFWSFTCNNNAQILHLGRCECEFGSTMAW